MSRRLTLSTIVDHVCEVHPTESGRRFVASCTCGYLSTTRRTEHDACTAAAHHLRLLEAELKRNGLGRPGPSTVMSQPISTVLSTTEREPDAGKRSHAS